MIRRWFGKRDAPPPVGEADRLTLDLLQTDWQCACCGEWHHGLMDMAYDSPAMWPYADDPEPNSALRTEGDFLSEDFCVIGGQHFLVRGVLEIPVHGLDTPFGWGCWTSLSRANFDKYVEAFDDDAPPDAGPWFGWLCNPLKIYAQGDQSIKLDVFPQRGRQRPRLTVQDADHPLGRAQREGISADEMLTLLRAYGHGPRVQ